MADRHQNRADDDGAAPAEHAVGKKPAENRREINQPGIKAPDLRRQRLHVERAEHGFKRVLDGEQAGDIAGMVGQQQIFRHVEHKQRAHPVIGEALPHLGREQESEPARMAEKIRSVSSALADNDCSEVWSTFDAPTHCHAPRMRRASSNRAMET